MNIKNLSLNSWYEFKVTPVLKNHAEGVVAGTTSPPGGPYRTLCSGMHTILRKNHVGIVCSVDSDFLCSAWTETAVANAVAIYLTRFTSTVLTFESIKTVSSLLNN